MRPWSKALQDLFPAPQCRPIPARPWWRWVPSPLVPQPTLTRICGVRIWEQAEGMVCVVDGAQRDVRDAKNRAIAAGAWATAAARVDWLYPAQHPGFRPLQLWAAETGATVTLLQTVPDPDTKELIFEFADFRGSGYRGTDRQLRERLRTWSLIHDTVCPHVAPWSPP